MNDTTIPTSSNIQPCALTPETPIAFSPLPKMDFARSYPVPATMIGIDKKNENSRADGRDILTIWPPVIVDIEREVPGNTAEKIWQMPIQIAWPRVISSICQVRIRLPGAFGPADSDFAFIASTTHITIPPMMNDTAIMKRLSRCLPIVLTSSNDGTAVTTNATATRLSG